jgi:four helix bundle protein
MLLPKNYCRHERLNCYQTLLRVARWFRALERVPGQASLYDQGRRAAESAVLNLAEACYRHGKARLYHFRVAQGSTAEFVAVLDLVDHDDSAAHQTDLRSALAMMQGLR